MRINENIEYEEDNVQRQVRTHTGRTRRQEDADEAYAKSYNVFFKDWRPTKCGQMRTLVLGKDHVIDGSTKHKEIRSSR